MKRISLISFAVLTCLSLSACGTNNKQAKQDSEASSLKIANSKLKKKVHKHSVKRIHNKSSSSAANSSSQPSNNHQLSQGEINRQRGYDPNGNPLLPGQDHAAGANPDGSPDAWVQGQIDWAKQNGYLNPDGTETQKGIEADQEVERDSQPGMP